MSADQENAALEKIYAEAGQWIRMVNTIIWSMGAFLVTVSVSCIGIAVNNQGSKGSKWFLAGGSILLFGLWVYITGIYRETSAQARTVLIGTEERWGVAGLVSLYRSQGQVGMKWYSVYNAQLVALGALVIIWAVLLSI